MTTVGAAPELTEKYVCGCDGGPSIDLQATESAIDRHLLRPFVLQEKRATV